MKILATLAMAGAAVVAVAQTSENGDPFLHKVAQGGIAEVNAGSLAERKNIELPTAPSQEQQDTFNKLQALDGPRFDQQYVAEMVKAHERTVEMLESEIASGRDAETKALAQELLPTVQSHLREAYRLAGKEEQAGRLPK